MEMLFLINSTFADPFFNFVSWYPTQILQVERVRSQLDVYEVWQRKSTARLQQLQREWKFVRNDYLDGGFKIFFIFTPKIGEDSHFH